MVSSNMSKTNAKKVKAKKIKAKKSQDNSVVKDISPNTLRSGKVRKTHHPFPKFLRHAKNDFKGYFVILKGQHLEVTKDPNFIPLETKTIKKEEPVVLKKSWLEKIIGWSNSLFGKK